MWLQEEAPGCLKEEEERRLFSPAPRV